MERRRRRGGLSAAEQQELWQRWRQGESLSAIARVLDRRATVVRRAVARTGGLAPALRRRSPRALSLAIITPLFRHDPDVALRALTTGMPEQAYRRLRPLLRIFPAFYRFRHKISDAKLDRRGVPLSSSDFQEWRCRGELRITLRLSGARTARSLCSSALKGAGKWRLFAVDSVRP